MSELKIFSGRANRPLAEQICLEANVPLGEAAIQTFSDGELWVKYIENIRGDDVFIIQPTQPPAENLIELLIMLDAAKRASAKRVTAVIPYFGYARQDRKDQPRVAISAKLIANLITKAGADRVEHFSNRCTACHLCVSSCPTQVLCPSFLDYGIAGIFQPKMNYSVSYCNFDCVVCGQVCPTGAILPLESNTKKQVQIGKAHFVKDDCIVVTKKKDCGACSEHCPTKAVKMVPFEQRLVVPEVHDEICVGCGACEHACPVQPRKAIYVKSNLVHGIATKPKSEKVESSFDSKQEFPF